VEKLSLFLLFLWITFLEIWETPVETYGKRSPKHMGNARQLRLHYALF